MERGKDLSEEENLWLNALRRGIAMPTLNRLLTERKRHGSEVDAYVYAVLNANEELLKGASGMNWFESMLSNPEAVALMERKGIGNIEKAAREAREALDTARKSKNESTRIMLQSGEPHEKIAKYLFIPLEEVADIERELNAD
jgi:predicted urease superfamily metal-dependent hydrolase